MSSVVMSNVNYGIETPTVRLQDALNIRSASAIYGDGTIQTTAVTIAVADTWVELTGSVFAPTSLTKGVTVNSDDITIGEVSGLYRVTLTALLENVVGAALTRVLEIGVGVNGAEPTIGVLGVTTFASATPTTATGVLYLEFQQGDVLTLFAKNVTDTLDISVRSGDLVVELLDSSV